MSEPHSSPGTWGDAASSWSKEFFSIRVLQCSSVRHLRKAVEVERENKNREDRIERLENQIDLKLAQMSNTEITRLIESELENNEIDKEWIGTLNGAKQ